MFHHSILCVLFFVCKTFANLSSNYFDVNTVAAFSESAQFPSNCEEAVKQANTSSGIFLIKSPNRADPFYVRCLKDPAGGPAWTLIQRRQSGAVDFNREYVEYAAGFGDLNGEHFLGLIKINALTTFTRNELWIQLEDFEKEQRHARYDYFNVGDIKSGFTLHTIGAYSGTAGNSLTNHRQKPFSTSDRVNNLYCGKNCAEIYGGAWWFGCCIDSNLNGDYYGNGIQTAWDYGIIWRLFRGGFYSLKYAHMAIRPLG